MENRGGQIERGYIGRVTAFFGVRDSAGALKIEPLLASQWSNRES